MDGTFWLPWTKHGVQGMCAFMIDRDTPGISVGKVEDKLGRTSKYYRVIFEDVRVPAKNLLGRKGWYVVMKTWTYQASIAAMATFGSKSTG